MQVRERPRVVEFIRRRNALINSTNFSMTATLTMSGRASVARSRLLSGVSDV